MVERPMGDCESERSEKGFWGETFAYHKEFDWCNLPNGLLGQDREKHCSLT